MEESEVKTEMEGLLNGASNPASVNVENILKARIESSIKDHEQSDTAKQVQLFQDWNSLRDDELDRYYKLLQKKSRMQDMEQKKKKLTEEEQRLFFFDNYEKMEKVKRQKFAEWRRTWPSRTWAPQIRMPPRKEVTDDYIPPTVGSHARKRD